MTNDRERIRRYRRYLASELRAAALYDALARVEKDGARARVFEELRDSEIGHAKIWSAKLGAELPRPRLGAGGLLRLLVAKAFGTRSIVPLLVWEEVGELREYYSDPEARDIARDERMHERMLRGLEMGRTEPAPLWEEGRSTPGTSGSIRAGVFGVNDGLVSNFSLVMGVAGGVDNPDFVLLAGVAGLLAGASSMAAGEYVSMRSQREVYEHAIERERIEIRDWPDEETEELRLIYRAKGLNAEEADLVARRVMSDPVAALDTMAREALGLDPNELGNPWAAAIASFAAFTVGAVVPILPFLFGVGNSVVVSGLLSGAALAVVGAALAAASGNHPALGGLRMLLIGCGAAALTFAIGSLVGTLDIGLG